RRGNIVQVYPSVEYDFVPNTITAKKGDYVHIQWTGSDANQRGNAGNGRDGTDRNNLVLFPSQSVNTPTDFSPDDGDPPTHFTNNNNTIAYLAYLNQTNCTLNSQDANDPQNCARLNAASGYQNVGLVRLDNPGVFMVMSTRNNAFSNRERESSDLLRILEKATLIVSEDILAAGAIAGIAIGSFTILGACAFGTLQFIKYGHKNPTSRPGKLVLAIGIKKPAEKPLPQPLDGEDIQQSWFKRTYLGAKFIEWWTWEGQRATIVLLYFAMNVGVWIYGFAMAYGTDPAPYYPYAKGFGKTLNINCAFILLPVLRNILCWLRSTPLADIVPLDDNINMHKLIFGFISVGTVGHVTFHYLDFTWKANAYQTDVGVLAWGSLAGTTGHVILLLMLLMSVTALFNRKLIKLRGKRYDGYRIFLLVHRLWIPCYVLLWLHGTMFWAFSILPLGLIGLEKLVQTRRAKIDVVLVEAKMVAADIMSVKMRLQGKKKKFHYKAGEYLFLNCPDIAELEWHPFTITSAPEEPHFGCHIRCRPEMDWCYQLRTLLQPSPPPTSATSPPRHSRTSKTVEPKRITVTPPTPAVAKTANLDTIEAGGGDIVKKPSSVRLRVDGPYGAPSEEVFDHSTVILVGAGIGVTPFISILKSMAIRSRQRQGMEGEVDKQNLKVYFYWICRDDQELLSFKDLIDAVIDTKDLRDVVSVNTYTTGELNLKKVRMESYNQFSGKPNWNRILREVSQTHQGEEIGVFMCGPLPLARELSLACKAQNQMKQKPGEADQRTVFRFHKENF
ncbi:NADPH oxidase 4, partial [Borealophlyctis nickersoniae]